MKVKVLLQRTLRARFKILLLPPCVIQIAAKNPGSFFPLSQSAKGDIEDHGPNSARRGDELFGLTVTPNTC